MEARLTAPPPPVAACAQCGDPLDRLSLRDGLCWHCRRLAEDEAEDWREEQP